MSTQTIQSEDLRAFTPANAARSIESAHRRVGTGAFEERLRQEAELTDPEAIAQAQATREGEASAYERAREFVAQSLVSPLLKQLRETSDAWGPFKPGKHEEALGWMLDEQVANKIVDSKNFPVVDRVAETLLDTQARRQAFADAQREARGAAS